MIEKNDRLLAVRARCAEVSNLAKGLYGVDLSASSRIGFNLAGKFSGLAAYHPRKHPPITFRFNREMVEGKHFEDILGKTVPHELAHGVCYLRPELGNGHDAGWQDVCLALGGTGRAKHNYDVILPGHWDYITDLGNKMTIRGRDHLLVQAGKTVMVSKRGLGKIDRTSVFAPSGKLVMPGEENGPRVGPGTWNKAREHFLKHGTI